MGVKKGKRDPEMPISIWKTSGMGTEQRNRVRNGRKPSLVSPSVERNFTAWSSLSKFVEESKIDCLLENWGDSIVDILVEICDVVWCSV